MRDGRDWSAECRSEMRDGDGRMALWGRRGGSGTWALSRCFRAGSSGFLCLLRGLHFSFMGYLLEWLVSLLAVRCWTSSIDQRACCRDSRRDFGGAVVGCEGMGAELLTLYGGRRAEGGGESCR